MPLPGALLVLTAALCPREGSLGAPPAPDPGPLQELPPGGAEVSSRSTSHSHTGTLGFGFSSVFIRNWYKGSVVAGSVGAGLPLCCFADGFGLFSVGENCSQPTSPLTEDNKPASGASPPPATQQVPLKQRWILGTLWVTGVPTEEGWRQGWCDFIFSVDEVVSLGRGDG